MIDILEMERFTEDARQLKKPRVEAQENLDNLYEAVQEDRIDLGEGAASGLDKEVAQSYLYGSSSSSEEDEDDANDDGGALLDEWQEAVLDEMEKCLDISPEATHNEHGQALVCMPLEETSTIRTNLWKLGPSQFLAKYQAEGAKYTSAQLLSALGFRLPIDFVAKYQEEQLAPFLLVATRHALSSRQKLTFPHTLDDLATVLGSAKNVIVLTGAGISTSLGIPDFRSESGLYNKLAHLGLSDPQEVFDISLFREDPSIFYSVAKDVLPSTEKFSPTHAFIKLLQDRGILMRNYTQNIDNLESYAGILPEKLVQCHGSFATATCITCKRQVEGSTLYPAIRAGTVPMCTFCSENKPAQPDVKKPSNGSSDDDETNSLPPSYGVMKPDITFFGEALPKRFEDLLLSGDAQNCDFLICIGTSLKVAPVSEIVRILPPHVPQIYISKASVYHNEFDVTFLGNCDDAVELLCQKMGWQLSHEMNRREPNCPLDKFPDGSIEFSDQLGLYKFVYEQSAGVTIPGNPSDSSNK